jgi:undecaprenyl-diphosphatase
VTVAVSIVLVVATTRLYLRVHYFTDVVGGIALGMAIWGLVGALAVVAGYLRQNDGPTR